MIGRVLKVLAALLVFADNQWVVQGERWFPITLTDGRGARVTIPARPQRIISLAPSTTQWLVALGAQNRIIGATEHCELPPAAHDVTRFTVHPTPSFEAIVGAKADLIVTADIASAAHVARLRELGQTVLVLNNDRYDGILRDGETLGAALGDGAQARALIARLRADREAVEASVLAHEPKPRGLLALSPALDFVAGPGSYADNLMRMAGVENVAGGAPTRWPKLSREAVVGADPDLIIVTESIDGDNLPVREAVLTRLRADPLWRHLSAVQAGRVGVVDSGLFNVPGPQVGEALRALRAEIEAVSGD